MRRLQQLSLHLTFGMAFSGFMVAPVMAQDLGTYRPGQAYQSITSPGADVCNSHCAGDAQCRAWNYVKVNPKAPGVCEFLATAATPVQSAISISGENVNQTRFARPLSQGGTNTVRVGTSAIASSPAPVVTRPAPNRRVVREAVPQRIAPQTTVSRQPYQGTGSLTEQQNQYRRQTGNLPPVQRPAQPVNQRQDPRLQQAAIPPQNGQRIGATQQQFRSLPPQQFKPFLDNVSPQANPQGDPRLSPQNQQALRERLRQNQAYQRQGAQGQSYQGQAAQSGARPPIGQPIPPASAQGQPYPPTYRPQAAASQSSANLPRSSAQTPVTHQNAQAAFARRQADLAAIASGNSVDPIQQSLYGTLNDDVKVPAALKAFPADAGAPIATSASRPVTPVQSQPLGQLAGGPR